MAQRLDTYEFKRRGRSSTYPWHEWADGDAWRLFPGVDFESAKGLISSAYGYAKSNGMKVRTSKEEDGSIVVQFTEDV